MLLITQKVEIYIFSTVYSLLLLFLSESTAAENLYFRLAFCLINFLHDVSFFHISQ